MNQLLNQAKDNFKKALEHYTHELSTLRTGRASSGLLATVTVESYGATMPLEHVASISIPDARTIVIQPFDSSQLGSVEKGIIAANIGVTPTNDGKVVRVTVPQLTEERRKDLVKMLGQLSEKCRIAIRNAREEVLKSAKKAETDGEMSKDDLEKFQKHLQTSVDEANAEVKSIQEEKEKEIMTV